MSPKQLNVNQCQFQNARGQRCNMLLDTNHRHGTGPATLCAFHAERLRAKVPLVDPEVLAAELLTDIDSFTTADEVNLFLGNLVRQLARKRIARRDAIALAYMSQLILTSQSAMAKQRASADSEAETGADIAHFLEGIRQGAEKLASLGSQQSAGGPQHTPANDAQPNAA